MECTIKELTGHSGSKIYLMKSDKLFVRKIGNVARNYERILSLYQKINLPKIYNYNDDILDMEYIHGLDTNTFLLYNKIDSLAEFIIDTIKKLSASTLKDYSEVYQKKLSTINYDNFMFDKEMLIEKLPKLLPISQYHGDFTLENILYVESNKTFYMIDPLTTEYDSYIFDIAKLKQDLICGWFNRKQKLPIDNKLISMNDLIDKEFQIQNIDYIVIAMLLRVYPYCKTKDDCDFIIKKANMLWK